MSDRSNSGGGVSFTGVLAIVFITLKLCGVINWEWLWVLSPIWIPLALLLLLGVVYLVMILVEKIVEALGK